MPVMKWLIDYVLLYLPGILYLQFAKVLQKMVCFSHFRISRKMHKIPIVELFMHDCVQHTSHFASTYTTYKNHMNYPIRYLSYKWWLHRFHYGAKFCKARLWWQPTRSWFERLNLGNSLFTVIWLVALFNPVTLRPIILTIINGLTNSSTKCFLSIRFLMNWWWMVLRS